MPRPEMARAADIAFACDCGQVRGHVAGASPRTGTHLACHCRDCRAAMIHLGRPDPAPGGLRFFHTSPDRIVFERGREHLAAYRLTPKGVVRFYAACCGTPLFGVQANPKLAMVGVLTATMEDAAPIGPVVAEAFVPNPAGGAARHKGMGRMVWELARRIVSARVSGRWRDSPFFDEADALIVEPRLLTREERAAVTPAR